MKVQRIYTDNRGSYIEVAEIVKIEEIEKKFEAEGVEYDTHEEAQAVLAAKNVKESKPTPVVEVVAAEDTSLSVSVTESKTREFDLSEKPVDEAVIAKAETVK